MHKFAFNKSLAYRQFTADRDKAAEKLLQNAQVRSSDVLRHAFGEVLAKARRHYGMIINDGAGFGLGQFDRDIDQIFMQATQDLSQVLHHMRANAYVMAKASEAEAIGQVTKEKAHAHISSNHVQNHLAKDMRAGGDATRRIKFYLDRIKRKVITFAQSSAMPKANGKPDTEQEYLTHIARAFPQRKVVKRPPKALYKVTEADPKKQKIDMSVATVDPDQWAQMVSDYKDDVVPRWREPEYTVNIPITDGTIQATTGDEVWYAWEFEKDLVNEFVQSVRDGQVDAAKDNGITDFVWIAVIDSATDECCAWRDGLLTSEIQAKLDDEGESDCPDGSGEGVTPPIHFNCRCTLAPATDDIPDRPDDGEKDFDEWLNS